MDARDGRIAEMNAAVSRYGWKRIAALAFYGNKEDLESYLQKECELVNGKIKIAQETQIETKQTLVGTNFTAYQLANHKNSKLVGWYAKQFVTWPTTNRNLYMELLVKYTGLFAIHAYIDAKIKLKSIEHKECVTRIDIFSKILTTLNTDKPAMALNLLLNHIKIPKGFISTEFFDLVHALKLLSDEQLHNAFKEYKHYMTLHGSLSPFNSKINQLLASFKSEMKEEGYLFKSHSLILTNLTFSYTYLNLYQDETTTKIKEVTNGYKNIDPSKYSTIFNDIKSKVSSLTVPQKSTLQIKVSGLLRGTTKDMIFTDIDTFQAFLQQNDLIEKSASQTLKLG